MGHTSLVAVHGKSHARLRGYVTRLLISGRSPADCPSSPTTHHSYTRFMGSEGQNLKLLTKLRPGLVLR
ncbi:hypothetical protein TB1_038411 [Malus domestica]